MNTEENKTLLENSHTQKGCIAEEVTNVDRFGLCKVSDVAYCKHMVNYGYAKYCFHPNWQSFVKKEGNKVSLY